MTDSPNNSSPFRKPGFIIAAVIIGLLVVLGIVLGIRALVAPSGNEAEPSQTSTPSETEPADPPAPEPTDEPAASDESVCGLPGVALSGRISAAPETTWEYDDLVAYPSSQEHGPGAEADEGYRFCFSHTPDGAVLAAANTAVMAYGKTDIAAWLDYVVADGPLREEAISQTNMGANSTRMSIKGFRLLSYDGDTASVDLAVQMSVNGESGYMAGRYPLVWENGDWKLEVEDLDNPFNFAEIPDTAGYVRWSE